MQRAFARTLLIAALFTVWGDFVPGQEPMRLPKYGSNAVRLFDAREHIQKTPAPDFWALLPYYRAQETDAGCSVPAVAMLLNALKVREPLLADVPLVTPKKLLATLDDPAWSNAVAQGGKGTSLEELGDVVRKSLAAYGLPNFRVEVVPIDAASPAELEKLRLRLTHNEQSDNNFLIANFLQSAFTDDPEGNVGHFAPIAAYDAKLRRVLILDPDRDWYEPYWVSDETFLAGMATQDPVTKKSRGYLWVHADRSGTVP